MHVEWRGTKEGLVPFVIDGDSVTPAVWAPQPGSQVAFSSCPVMECCYGGTRGPGKSDSLIMYFLQHVGKGWGAEWKGIIFRRTYPELSDLIEKCNKWIPRMFPGARYNQQSHDWSFQTGELLHLRHFKRPEDYWSYHGHSYTFIGWEELTTWATSECYLSMFSCARSTVPGIPIVVRSTTNPYGIGHNWVKSRFRLAGIPLRTVGPVIRDGRDREGRLEPERVYIHGVLSENKVMLYAQPDYIQNVLAGAKNPAQARAWEFGDWDVVSGGMFDDVWDVTRHVLPNFPPHLIPRGWRINRSYDHGQSRPFSVGWWAESNGEALVYKGHKYGTVRGDLIRFAEWYGWDGEENVGLNMLSEDIANGIVDRQNDMLIGDRVRPGPADDQIFVDFEPNKSVAGDMKRRGVRWTVADKGPGSRVQGWAQMRKMLSHAKDPVREEPGLFVCERCDQFVRTVPSLPRSDKNPDDVHDKAEDHIGDETRYRLREKDQSVSSGVWK